MSARASTIPGTNASVAEDRSRSQAARTANGPGRGFRPLVHAALLVAGICGAAAQDGQVANPGRPMTFHIPSQPLSAALQAYGQTTGVQVLYESNSALGKTSVAVEGSFAPQAALRLLLAATDLKVRYIRPDAITLAPPDAENVAVAPGSSLVGAADLSLGTLRVRGSTDGDETARLNQYSERVQLDIQNALRKDASTRDGSYRAVLDLWIDPARRIERTDLFRSTGDRERDAAIAVALRGVAIGSPAPANAPRPVRISIVVRSLQ
jgi:hypothetical protein